jgi:protein O-GlcNAc transferase
LTRSEFAAVQAEVARGAFSAARTLCRAALARNAQDRDALRLDAGILLQLGEFAAAVAPLEACVRLRPGDAESIFLLGAAWQALGDVPRAQQSYLAAIAVDGALFEARANLAMLLRRQGDFAGAIKQLEAAIVSAPAEADLHFNLGVVREAIGAPLEATAAYRQALALRPGHAPALCNLGVLLHRSGDLDGAERALRAALDADASQAAAMVSLSSVLKDLGLVEDARTMAGSALRVDPASTVAASNHVLFGAYLRDDRQREAVAAEFRRLDLVCSHGAAPARGAPLRALGASLRLGYVSADFRDHTVAYFIEPLLAAHDRGAVELHCYDCSPYHDAVSRRLRSHPGVHWHDCTALDAPSLARQIESDRIDVLVDLMGNTANNRLPVFALRPAPLQASWIGWPDTTGLSAMDCLVGDRHVFERPGFDQYVSETLLALPDTWLCYSPDARAGAPRAARIDADAPLVLGSLNAVYKLNRETVDTWARVMERLPSARLLIAGVPPGRARERVRALVSAAGMDSARVAIEGPLSLEAFFAAHRQIDIALDPFPFNGGTTTFHSLWMGVPVVTLAGRRFAGRMGYSIMRNLALESVLVAPDAASYVERVVALAQDADMRLSLHRTLRDRILASPLVDGPRQALAVESMFREARRGHATPAAS